LIVNEGAFEDEPNNETSNMEATGNDFEPVEDENSIDDVSNKSVGVPEDRF